MLGAIKEDAGCGVMRRLENLDRADASGLVEDLESHRAHVEIEPLELA